jgi:Family of unknown function (DUF6510)
MSAPFDGNAIAGQLYEVFGTEMTAATAVCGNCGASGRVAELAVYLRAPGVVGRCRQCSAALIVLVAVGKTTCVDLRGVASLEH